MDLLWNGTGTCRSVEQAMHELVALTHLRAGKQSHVNAVHPHYFKAALPVADRWRNWALPEDFVCFDPLASTDEAREMLQDNMRAGAFDQSVISHCDDEPPTRGRVAFTRYRHRKLTPALAGKMLPTEAKFKIYEVATGMFDRHGRWTGVLDYIACTTRRIALVRRLPRRNAPEAVPRDLLRGLLATQSLALSLRYEWQLTFGYEQCVNASVVIERDALPDFVRLRDIPDGKRRRDALVHFVSAHRRRKAAQSSGERPDVFVRKHLRGQTLFRWDGLVCEIVPPRWEVEKLDRERDPAAFDEARALNGLSIPADQVARLSHRLQQSKTPDT